ncbi:MAG: hypothetical protein CVV13_02480 [Gammaproteobacteria bacterium HGW-Gammaproteobacteria-3]|jgi:hypothetical protein|nr:MAG: hypothetical protein CVV13_02480 [Gammaproteobacteria bacterium HGW-Gammaproteobacteria-3]
MNTKALRQYLTADANRMIHIALPEDLLDTVEVIVMPTDPAIQAIDQEKPIQAQVIDDTGFVQCVINSPVEDCWNTLV